MQKLSLLLLLCSFFMTFAQQKKVEIDTISWQERYLKIRKDAPKISMDSSQKRSILYSKQLKNILDKYKNKNDKTYKAANDVYYNLQNIILFSYVVKNQYDSVVKLQQNIEKESTNKVIVGSAYVYRSYAENDKNNIVKSLEFAEKAYYTLKLSGNKNKELRSFLSLVQIYVKTTSYINARELLNVFEKENDIESLPNFFKNQFKINNAAVIAELDNTEKAILTLNSFDLNSFGDENIQLNRYYIILSRLYLKAKKYNKALETIDNFNKSYKIKAGNSQIYHILSAEAYLGLKNYQKALYHLEAQKKKLTKEQLATDIGHHAAYYRYYKAQNNYKKALGYYETAQSNKDSLSSKQYLIKAAVLNYNLKKDKELIRLEEVGKAKDIVLIKNKQFYTYITIIISLAVGTIIFFVMFFYRKKKTYQLRLENTKNQELTALKNKYIENLSHEIRTPLTIIQGYLGLIRNNIFNTANILSYIEKSLKSSDTIIKELNDFLTILKLEKKEFTSKTNSNNIGKFLNETIVSFEGVTTLKKIKLFYKTNIRATKIITEYDFASLKKIIDNLVSNAIKYSNTGTDIYIQTLISKKELTVIVKDKGIGISKEDLPNIFSRFYQAKEHNINGGFGIGLSLVNDLVKRLRGEITVISEKNIGSTFTVKFPIIIKNYELQLKEVDVDYTLLNEVHQNDITPADNSQNKPKILVVDDNVNIVSYLQELLKTDFNFTPAFNGNDAIKLAKEIQFDLIISDLRMPMMQGFELKKELNALENYKDVPFLIMSASTFEKKSDLNVSLGVDDFIIKPFKANELLTRIYNLLENKIFRNKLQKIETIDKIEFYGHYAELMDKVNRIIKENIKNEDFSVETLAKECNYSQRQLVRILQAKTGLTAVKIILEVRLTKAYELLQKKEFQTVKEVVYATGFNSVPYFNRVFMKRFGVKAIDLLK